MFELIQKYYRMGIYSENDLELFVSAGLLTQKQMIEIRGDA